MFRSLRDDFNLPRCLRYKALHVSCGKLKIDWLDNVRAVPGEIWWCDVYHARSDCFESWEISKVSNLLHIGLLLAYHPYHPMSISEIPWNIYMFVFSWRMLGETVPTVDETWIQRIRSSRTAATSMDDGSWPIFWMPFLFHIYHNMFGWIENMSIPLTRYIYIILHIYIHLICI